MTRHFAESYEAVYSFTLSARRKCRFSSGMRSFLSILLKHMSMSAFAKLRGWVIDTSLPSTYHSSMAQKWPWRTSMPRSFTISATRGSCSVGPMGPQMPAGRLAVAARQVCTYSSASAV